MKILANFSRIFVGLVFTFSGFVKLQDPVGTKIKMQEYFSVFSADLPALAPLFAWMGEQAIYVSVFMCALELILGIALLIGYKPKFTAWALLLIVIYFGFLTFYSAYFNKVTDCGCFGDFMHLKPWASFWKDMVLLFFILIILWQIKHIKATNTALIMALVTLLSIGLGVYTNYMEPLLDFRAYKVGANIPANMQPSEKLRFEYTMVKNGEEKTFTEYPTDTTWVYKDMKVLNEDAKPKITDYNIWNATGDYTQKSFEGKQAFIILHNLKYFYEGAVPQIKELTKTLKSQNINLIIVSSAPETDIAIMKAKYGFTNTFYSGDEKVLKTIARVNPSLWTLNNGTVTGKWSGYNLPSATALLEIIK